MRILTFILLMVVLLGTACEAGEPIVVTATPPSTSVGGTTTTPTQEINTWTPEPTSAPYWDVTCIGDTEPINPVACPSDYRLIDGQAVPATMALRIDPITNGATQPPELSVIDGDLRINVSGFAGEIGIQIHNILMEEGHCYTLNTPLEFNFLGASNFSNYWYDSRIYSTDGGIADLNNHPVIVTPGGQGIMAGERGWDGPMAVWWGFSPSGTHEVVWEWVYHATWASVGGDHWIDISAFVIQDQFNTSICS